MRAPSTETADAERNRYELTHTQITRVETTEPRPARDAITRAARAAMRAMLSSRPECLSLHGLAFDLHGNPIDPDDPRARVEIAISIRRVQPGEGVARS